MILRGSDLESGSKTVSPTLNLVRTYSTVYRIFFGILPITKASWRSEIQSQRESYYVRLPDILDGCILRNYAESYTSPSRAILDFTATRVAFGFS